MKRFLCVITLIFVTPQIHALTEQHDVNQAEETEEFKPADDSQGDVQLEQHDINQAEEAEEFKPADAD